jgi:hypothetical protein
LYFLGCEGREIFGKIEVAAPATGDNVEADDEDGVETL